MDVDTIVVAVGGGGLMAGVAAAAEGAAKVVAVEPTTCPTLHTALQNGGPVDIAVSGIAADSLGAPGGSARSPTPSRPGPECSLCSWPTTT